MDSPAELTIGQSVYWLETTPNVLPRLHTLKVRNVLGINRQVIQSTELDAGKIVLRTVLRHNLIEDRVEAWKQYFDALRQTVESRRRSLMEAEQQMLDAQREFYQAE